MLRRTTFGFLALPLGAKASMGEEIWIDVNPRLDGSGPWRRVRATMVDRMHGPVEITPKESLRLIGNWRFADPCQTRFAVLMTG